MRSKVNFGHPQIKLRIDLKWPEMPSDLNNVRTDCWLTTTWYQYIYTYRQLCWERGNIHCVRPLGRMHTILVELSFLYTTKSTNKDGLYYSLRTHCGLISIITHTSNLRRPRASHTYKGLTRQIHTVSCCIMIRQTHDTRRRLLAAWSCLFQVIHSWYDTTETHRDIIWCYRNTPWYDTTETHRDMILQKHTVIWYYRNTPWYDMTLQKHNVMWYDTTETHRDMMWHNRNTPWYDVTQQKHTVIMIQQKHTVIWCDATETHRDMILHKHTVIWYDTTETHPDMMW